MRQPLAARCAARPRSAWVCGFLLALLVTACLAGAVEVPDQNEPAYRGRSLSDWTRDLDPHGRHEPHAWTAIGHMGTNAIPTLLRWMSEPDPPEIPKTNVPACFNTTRSERAEMAFRILGEAARPAIPELSRLARTSSDPWRAKRCADSLASIGPEAIPSLLSLATNGPPWTRYWALEVLQSFAAGPEGVQTVPVIMNCLGDTNTYNVGGAAQGLLLALPPAIQIPAITNALQSPSARARLNAITCLWMWADDAPAMVPVPAVRAAMRDQDYQVRDMATNILSRMGKWQSPSANPQGGANGRQPVQSETNRTPAAAASRRSP
jgi:hypothetical protein